MPGERLTRMDLTGQPDNFVVPTRTAEQRERRNAMWKEVLDALVNMASEGERGTVRDLFEKEVPYEAPRSWMRDVENVFKRDFAGATPERFKPAAIRLHGAVTVLREHAESDPDLFPSPVGQALHQTFQEAMFHALDSAALRHSVSHAFRAIVMPALKTAMKNPDALVIASIARQRGTVPFEIWANRFRGTVNRLLEGWYRPMVSAFYRLSRLPVVDGIPVEVAQLGQMFGDARTHWPAGSPLSLLVLRLITIVRNSEAHNNTSLDLDTERFIFINKNPFGVERDRWSASPAEFERLAIHVDHLGELMQTFLLTVPFRSLVPDLLFALLTDLFSSAERTPAEMAGGAQ
jgi:hypothetical protein